MSSQESWAQSWMPRHEESPAQLLEPPDALAGPAALMGPERRASRGWRAVQAPWERWQLPSDNDTPVRFMAAISSGGADELFIGSFSKQGGGRAGWCPGERS